MTWAVDWAHVAAEDLRRLRSWKDAARIDRAVQDFAANGHGTVKRVNTDQGVELRLYVGNHFVRFVADHATRTIHVLRIFRAS